MNIGSSLRAAMRGLPVRAVSSSTVAPFFALVTREKSVQDLKGKIVGVTDPGGTNYQVTKIILSQYGLIPIKDVPLITIVDRVGSGHRRPGSKIRQYVEHRHADPLEVFRHQVRLST
jgi:hypothetical protein